MVVVGHKTIVPPPPPPAAAAAAAAAADRSEHSAHLLWVSHREDQKEMIVMVSLHQGVQSSEVNQKV